MPARSATSSMNAVTSALVLRRWTAHGLPVWDAVVLVAWTVAGLVIAGRWFRWEP